MAAIQYEGNVYRPPSEAASLIIQATIGCSNNSCAFCSMYKEKCFRLRPLETVLAELDWAKKAGAAPERIFLADGDALIRPTKDWLAILGQIRRLFPGCRRVGCYASPKSVLGKSPAELQAIREAGLGIAYMGLESGSDKVLKDMNKGSSAGEIIEAGQKLRRAGLCLSVTAINGLGGLEDMEEHGVQTGLALSKMQPEYIGLLTLMVEPGTPLYGRVEAGKFRLLSPAQVLAEIRLILENCDSEGSLFRANHASNYLSLGGQLNRDRAALIARIDAALAGRTSLRPEWQRGL